MILTFSSFLLLIFSGIPIVFALGAAATVTLIATSDVPLAIVAQRIYGGLDSFPIMAIPFFVMAGVIMEVGGIARRFVALANALVGWITGSLLMVAIVTTTGLSAISGSGSADTAAVGSMLLPEMKKRGYHPDFAAAIVAAGGGLGPIIPPSIIMVVIAITSNLSIGAMFLGGILPGLLMAVGLLFVAWLHARRGGPQYQDAEPFSLARLGRTFLNALPALSLPFIVVGGIIGGVFTATEASCIAVIAGLLISFFVYRELKPADLPELILRTVSISSAVMIIIGTAAVFSWLIASQGVPALIGGWLRAMSDQPWIYPAGCQRPAADCRHVHGKRRGHPHPDAGADADRARLRHRSRAFRRGGRAEPVDRPDYAALRHLSVRLLHNRQAVGGAGVEPDLAAADPDDPRAVAIDLRARDHHGIAERVAPLGVKSQDVVPSIQLEEADGCDTINSCQ